MQTHAQVAAQLLREAARFFRSIADQNPAITKQMIENADVYQQAAELIETDPTGVIPEHPGDSAHDHLLN